MKSIQSTGYKIYFKRESYANLNIYINSNGISSVFILVDTNTKKYCLSTFLENIGGSLSVKIIEISAGEIHKNITTCVEVWNKLTNEGADRKSLLINLGGGMVTDLGGFVASTYKRGIRFINVPTSLLSMVDASVGSKTGIDLGNLKNLIGLFSNPEMVLIDDVYLQTIPKRELRSGFAEIIKYGLSYDVELWNNIYENNSLDNEDLLTVIQKSIAIKNSIILQDLTENNLRKILNFGHTIGHAVESYFLEDDTLETLTHGEAIAIGMICELYLSYKILNFPIDLSDKIKGEIVEIFGKVSINNTCYDSIIELTKYDKKNINNEVNFVLLNKPGDFKLDCKAPNKLIKESLDYYNS